MKKLLFIIIAIFSLHCPGYSMYSQAGILPTERIGRSKPVKKAVRNSKARPIYPSSRKEPKRNPRLCLKRRQKR